MTGFSGIDVADMVHQIMRAESFRVDRLRQQRELNMWRQDAMRGVVTSMNQFQRNWTQIATGGRDIGNRDNWNSNSATITGMAGATGATVNATVNAQPGTHTLGVLQVAQADTLRTVAGHNFNVENPGTTTTSMDFSHLIDATTGNFTSGMNFNVHVNGVTRNISATAAEMDGFLAGARDDIFVTSRLTTIAGLDATNDAAQIASLRSQIGGFLYDHIIAQGDGAGTFIDHVNTQLASHFGNNTSGVQRAEFAILGTGPNATLAFVATAGNTGSVLNGTGAGAMNTHQMGLTENAAGGAVNMGFSLAQSLEDFLGTASNALGTADASFAINGVRFEMDFTNNSITTTAPGQTPQVFETTGNRDLSIQDLMNAVNRSSAAGVTMSFNNLSGQFTMQANQTGVNNRIEISDYATAQSSHNFVDLFFQTGSAVAADARISEARDAVVTIDGVEISRSTNNFTVNGLQINLTNASAPAGSLYQPGHPNYEPIATRTATEFTITVGRDTNDVRQMIVDFVESYNELVRSMLDLTESRRPRQDGNGAFFMPLTEEERRGMSDREIEIWETQARTGILHRDDTLRTIQNELTNVMFANITMPDGRRFNLGNMGIQLSRDLTQGGMLTIDEDRFEFALANHMDVFEEMFTGRANRSDHSSTNEWLGATGLVDRLNFVIDRATSTSTDPTRTGSLIRRAGYEGSMFVNNNDFSRMISRDNSRIDNMMGWLQRREDSLFAQFSRMEQAMMQAHSQMMFFEQLLWGGM